MGSVVTFYSYKGGTGRSMALANVAHILAWQLQPRRKILMIDWDLEAPGLHRYFYEQLQGNFPRSVADHYASALNDARGLIDFLDDARGFYQTRLEKDPTTPLSAMHAETAGARQAFDDFLATTPLSGYLLSVSAEEDSPPEAGAPGLHLLKAGSQASSRYTNLIRTFPWQDFYEKYGSFFTCLRQHLETEYDVVLLDSRTGLTDIGDICTRVMPEKLVGVFVPNEQNIEGLTGVLRGAAEYRKKSRDPRGLMIFPLASRIDAQRSLLRQTWWKGGEVNGRKVVGYEPRFEKLLSELYQLDDGCDLESFFDNTQLPHDADFAFGEDVAARSRQTGRLTIGYACANLGRYLVSDCAPWERLSDATEAPVPAPAPAAASAPRPEMSVPTSRMMLLVIAGFCVALMAAGPSLERSLFSSGEAQPDAIVKDIVYGPPLVDIAGFGMGTATIHLSVRGVSNKTQPLVISLKASRGKVSPETFTPLYPAYLPSNTNYTSSPVTAVVTSEGLGDAYIAVTRESAPSEPVRIPVSYHWPVAVTCAALAGALFGAAYRISTMLKGPFQRRRPVVVFVAATMDVLLGLIIALVYVQSLARLLADSFRFAPIVVALVAAAGVILYHPLIQPVLSGLDPPKSR